MTEFHQENPQTNSSAKPVEAAALAKTSPGAELQHTILPRFIDSYITSAFQEAVGISDTDVLEHMTQVFLDSVRASKSYSLLMRSENPVLTHAVLMAQVPAQYKEFMAVGFQRLGDATLFCCSTASHKLNKLGRDDSTTKQLMERGRDAYTLAAKLLSNSNNSDQSASVLITVRDNFAACCHGLAVAIQSAKDDASLSKNTILF